MYQPMIVFLKIGKSIEDIVQEVGFIQWDNMAPVILLFLMVTFFESLGDIWEDNGMEEVELHRVSNDDFEKG